MDTLNIYISGKSQAVNKKFVIDIKDGKALMNTGRWHKIDCDHKDCELVEADRETHIPESYRVCNICNKVTYLKE
ncbi:MAG: hypothetical protein GWP19_08130 [Planctomycetia bacterium]|nr:hypothetical protein [Planctomycetia bacterium]